MTRASILVRAAAVALVPAAAASQTPAAAGVNPRSAITLEQAIAEGLRAEPGVRAAALEVEAARGDAQQSALRPNPAFSFEEREQMGGPDRQTSLAAELPLDLFRRDPRIEGASRTADSAAAGLDDRRRMLAAAIREQYGEVLIVSRRLDVLDAVLAASRRTYELLRDRVGEGATPPIERDVALVEVRRLEGDRALASGRVAVAITRLKALLGRSVTADLTLADSLEAIVSQPQTANGTKAEDRADVRQAAADLAAAAAKVREVSQDGKPDVAVFGGYMRMDSSFPQQGLNASGAFEPIHGVFENASFGVKLTIPIFNRGQGSVAAAKSRELSAAAALDARRLGAAADVAAANARLDAARRALATYSGDARGLAQRNLDVVRETYTFGRATLFDVLNEQRRYLDFEAGFTDALAEAFLAQSDLKRAQGELR